MTRKDYKKIAAAIKKHFEVADLGERICVPLNAQEALEGLTLELVDVFSGDNQNFKKDVFLKACGVN